MSSIFQIVDDFDALWQLMEEAGGDITGCEAEYDSFVTELNTNLEQKADNYAWVISHEQSKADTAKGEIARLQALVKSSENKAKKLKELLKQAMEMTGKGKIETAYHKFGIQKNGGKQPIDIQIPARELPCKYQIQQDPVADLDLLRTDLQAGVVVPGANLIEVGTHLRIR